MVSSYILITLGGGGRGVIKDQSIYIAVTVPDVSSTYYSCRVSPSTIREENGG
jgi:hypothetical protein